MVKSDETQRSPKSVDFDLSRAIARLNSHIKAVEAGKGLNDLHIKILEQVWLGAAYKDIAQTLNYDADYIKRIAAQLWKQLSQVTQSKVSKGNICSLLQKYDQATPESTEIQALTQQHLIGEACSLGGVETRWVGRENIIPKLCEKLHAHCYFLSIAGLTGVGKSSLAMRLILDPSQNNRWDKVEIICCDRSQSNFEQLTQQILGTSPSLQSAPNAEILASLVEAFQTHPYLIVIDMVEELLIADGNNAYRYEDSRFQTLFEQIITLENCPSRFILTSQIQPPRLLFGRYPHREHVEKLEGLTEDESLKLFQIWDIPLKTPKDIKILLRFARTYEGHALALRVIAGDIRSYPYQGNIQAYWNDYGDEIEQLDHIKKKEVSEPLKLTLSYYSPNLADLVEKRVQRSFEHLQTQHPLAYLLLCMGSIFRGSMERAAWLIQIGEASKREQMDAFQTLQRRFLLEEDLMNGRIMYRLHSLIRSVALEHLEQMETKVG